MGGRVGEVEGGRGVEVGGGGRRSLGEVIVRLCYCKHRLYASLDAPFLGLESILGGRKRGVGGMKKPIADV